MEMGNKTLNSNLLDLHLQLATYADIDVIMQLISDAIELMEANNNFQWNKDYPKKEHIITDLENERGYVLKDNDIILGYVAIVKVEDKFNSEIKHKEMFCLNTNRLVTNWKLQIKGIGSKIMSEIIEIALKDDSISCVKGTTNSENKIMQGLFAKFGFKKVGLIRMPEYKTPNFYTYEKDIRIYN